MSMLLSIAAGGAVGAVGRYLAMAGIGHWLGHGFPYGTLVVNIIGSFLLGALIEVSALTWSPSPEMRAFFVVGVLGAFTTFSAFSLDVVTLIERGDFLPAAFYIIASVVVSIAALFFGMIIFRHILA
ncbi:MAG: fluoride efflux transporter CrcB [Rhodospirillaceae bacterium]|jgi:fluoride exporter|nr:fluoride efflux transporter CrcB [Rhodospirillaceae bacterium]MBT4587655.1 fluoride efflux transporter CrcB [Rhodospirillaceae bacterium]MBT4940356.1 fluoride efflux transporter CrcB [Rhodospirillaceae bacterium]MBT5939869.1 fluoride efflux transporter CrcB [Rhodospirillaceae bacterium]MBT7265468.1 fluoride efflux transporter CrcB [Rhodospirillaceae bacterium]